MSVRPAAGRRPSQVIPLIVAGALGAACSSDPTAPPRALVASTPRADVGGVPGGGVTSEPIGTFIDATAPTCSLLWIDQAVAPAERVYAWIDFTGYLQRLYPAVPRATYDGSVKTQTLGDGSTRVTVQEDATNVLAYAFTATAMVFGHKPSEITAGAPATVGTARFRMTFTVPAGEPMPTFCQALSSPATYYVTQMQMQLTTAGPLRVASGYAEGTPGTLTVVQNGLYGRPPQLAGTDNPMADNYPVERVIVAPNVP